METTMQTEKVCLKKEKLSVNVEQIVENDMSLADYYGDIVKILGTVVTTNVFSSSITGDKAVIDGCVRVSVLYIDNNGKSEIFETDCPFNRAVDVKAADAADTVAVSVISEQVTCRAVNQRRAEIRGSVSLKVTVSGIEECQIISADGTNFCHVLECKADGDFIASSVSKSYTLSASADIDSGVNVKKIYRSSAMATVNEIKTIKNKMMIKGVVTLDVIMLTADGSFISKKINIPVNQIVDINGLEEEQRCCVTIRVTSTDLHLISDTPQSPAHIEASVIINADIDAYIHTCIKAVSEAYSPLCELICEQKNIKYLTDTLHVNENYLFTAKMDFSSCNAVSIADAAVKKIRYTVQAQNNTITLKGNIHFGIVVISKDNEKLYFERISDFEYTKQSGNDVSECDFQPVISVNATNCSINESSQAIISTELYIDGFVNTYKTCNVITAVEKGKERERTDDDCIITVYFASKGERLWDIAKEHSSSVELIKALNDTDGDVISSECMLVFELE